MNRHQMLDHLREYMDDTQLLDELNQAMSDSEAEENYQHIARMWDIPGFDEDEDEDEDED